MRNFRRDEVVGEESAQTASASNLDEEATLRYSRRSVHALGRLRCHRQIPLMPRRTPVFPSEDDQPIADGGEASRPVTGDVEDRLAAAGVHPQSGTNTGSDPSVAVLDAHA
jgi:hypothetical protein